MHSTRELRVDQNKFMFPGLHREPTSKQISCSIRVNTALNDQHEQTPTVVESSVDLFTENAIIQRAFELVNNLKIC